MKTSLLYGRGALEVQLPPAAQVTVVRKPEMPILDNPERAVREALKSPIGSPSLSELAQSSTSACIAICDITRPVPNHLFLRPMIETMIGAGIAPSSITVLIATGLHRPNEGEELNELVGDPWVKETVDVVNHFARCDEDHVDLGSTSTRNTKVRLDRRFVDADLRIATGLVEPHFMAGYSGGRKVIAPGLAHAETITTFHSARFMSDPAADNCNLRGNPLHEEQLEIVKMLGGAFALNTIIDENRNLSLVNFGEIVESHQHAVDFARRYCEVSLPRSFHTVVTSAAGYPLDKTYYQTVKGMVGAMNLLKPGGNLVIASQCSEGMGSPEFVASQKHLVASGPAEFLERIHQQSHAAIDEWQTQMQIKPMQVGNIHLYSDQLPLDSHAYTGVNIIDSVEQAIESSIAQHNDPHVAIIPEGPYVVPFVKQ